MDHQFVAAEGDAAQGVWFEDNGSIVCRWWWDPMGGELLVRAGSASQIEPVSISAEVMTDRSALEDQLKSTALAIAQRMASERG